MNKDLFIGMGCGVFVGNIACNKLIFGYNNQDAVVEAIIATLIWILLFSAYLKYFTRKTQ